MPQTPEHPDQQPARRRWFRLPRVILLGGSLLLTVAIGSACSSNSSTPAGPASNASASQGAEDAQLTAYVATVCKATSTLEQTVGRLFPATGGPGGTPAGDPSARAGEIQSAANALLTALKGANPPAVLKDYNDQLIGVGELVVAAARNSGFAFGQGGDRPGRGDATPPARPSGTPRARASGTPLAGGRNGGGGVASLLARNLPAPPASIADQLQQVAADNPDCVSSGFLFGGQ